MSAQREAKDIAEALRAISDAERYASQMERQLGALEHKLDELLSELTKPAIKEDAKSVEPDIGSVDGLEARVVGESAGGVQAQAQDASTANKIEGGDGEKEEASSGDGKLETRTD